MQQNNFFSGFHIKKGSIVSNNVILSKFSGEYIPVKIKSRTLDASTIYPKEIEYDVFEGRNHIGFVYLRDEPNGCYVQRIKNLKPEEFGKFGILADKLEVQYCMDKGLKDFQITSFAAENSHAVHYLRGKRFQGFANKQQIDRFKELFKDADIKSFNFNAMVKYIIDHTPKGERFNTKFLTAIPMYMPKELIQKYVQQLLKNPLIIK